MEKFKLIVPDKIELGQDFSARLERVEQFPLPPNGSLLRVEGESKAYWMQHGKRRWIETMEVFDKMATDLGFAWGSIQMLESWQMETIPEGKIISHWPEDELNEYNWVKGLLTEAQMPNANQIQGMNFNTIMAFHWLGNEKKLKALANIGIKLIPRAWQVENAGIEISPAFEAEYNILAYFIYDEPEYYYEPSRMIDRVWKLRDKTKLPITINFTARFWMDNPEWFVGEWHKEYPQVFKELDFVSFDSYWYRGGGFYQKEYDYVQEAIKRIKAEGKSIIGVAQGHQDAQHDITQPDMTATNKVWKDAGAGVIWYCWEKAEAAIGARPGDTWYNEQIKKINQDL